MALHYGEAAYGNVGSGIRLDFTVIGKDVGLASRIGGMNRPFNQPRADVDRLRRAPTRPERARRCVLGARLQGPDRGASVRSAPAEQRPGRRRDRRGREVMMIDDSEAGRERVARVDAAVPSAAPPTLPSCPVADRPAQSHHAPGALSGPDGDPLRHRGASFEKRRLRDRGGRLLRRSRWPPRPCPQGARRGSGRNSTRWPISSDFGVAPALTLYFWNMHERSRVSAGSPRWCSRSPWRCAWPASMSASTTRTSRQWSSHFFTGMPAPAGAIVALLPLLPAPVGPGVSSSTHGLVAVEIVYLLCVAGSHGEPHPALLRQVHRTRAARTGHPDPVLRRGPGPAA